MTNQELRYTGFNDPLGTPIFEGDYLVLKLSDLTPEEIETRHLSVLISKYNVSFMQAYIRPTGQLRYDIDLILLDDQHRPLTEAQYFYTQEKEPITEEEFFSEFGKHSSLTEVYTVFARKQLSLFKGIALDDRWFKVPALCVRETNPIQSGLFDNQNNPIGQGKHFLFSIPDDVYNNNDNRFYGSQLGQDMMKLSSRYYLVYIKPTPYISLDLNTVFLKDDLTPVSIADEETLLCRDAKDFSYDGVDLNTVDKRLPAISFATDAFIFVQYLIAKGWLVLEPNPSIDLSVFEHPTIKA